MSEAEVLDFELDPTELTMGQIEFLLSYLGLTTLEEIAAIFTKEDYSVKESLAIAALVTRPDNPHQGLEAVRLMKVSDFQIAIQE